MTETAPPSRPDLFPLGLGGLLGGAGGTLAGHWTVLAAHRLTGDADIWLKGPHGPPFFDLALATACFFGLVGAGVASGTPALRARRAATAFAAAFAAFAGPMWLATRLFSWGEAPNAPPTYAWVYVVLGAYAAAYGLSAFVCGWRSAEPPSPRRGLGGAAGGAAAFAGVFLVKQLVPVSAALPATSLLPPAADFFSGAVWGAFVGAGTALAGGRR